MVKSYVDGQVLQGRTRVVVLGDFNDAARDPPASNVFNAFLNDPLDYTVATEPLDDGAEFTYIPFTDFLDHLVVTSPVAAWLAAGRTTVVHLDELVQGYDYVTQLSDHRPVVSILPR